MQGSFPKLEVVLSIDVLEAIVKALMLRDDGQYPIIIERTCHFEHLLKTLSFAEDLENLDLCTNPMVSAPIVLGKHH